MDLSLAQLATKLAKGLRGGTYFLHGGDPFLRSEAVALLLDAHLDPSAREFSLDSFRGDSLTAEALAAAAATPPLLSRYRVLVVRDAQALAPSARATLESLLGKLPDDVVLLVTAEIPKGSTARLYQILRREGTSVRLEPPDLSALPGWLMERARTRHGIELEPAAAELLAAFMGRAPGPLAEELAKLSDYVAPRTRAGVDDVRAVAGALPQVTRWDWIDFVLAGRFDDAVASLRDLFDSGESAVGLVAALGEALVRVGLAGHGEALARALKRDGAWGYLAWKVPHYRKCAAAWPAPIIERGLEECLRTDRLLKSGGLEERALLEELLLRLAAIAQERAAVP